MTKTQNPSHTMRLLLTGFFAAISLFLLHTTTTHAATFTVAAGNDENTDNASCSLTEAIENINDQATTNTDCSPTGAYGTDDTINLPSGTITLTANTPDVSNATTFQGQGMDVSIIDGDGAYHLGISGDDVTYDGLTIQAYVGRGIFSSAGDVTISQVEIDGTGGDVSGGALFGVGVQHADGEENDFNFSDLYIHNLSGDADTGAVAGIFNGATQDSILNYDIDRVTIFNLVNTAVTGTSTSALIFTTGVTDGSFTPGTINADIDNATVNNIYSTSGGAGGIATLAAVNGGNTQISVNLRNSTLTNFRGLVNAGTGDAPTSGVGLLGAAVQPGDDASVSVDLTNVILADNENTQTSASNNCSTLDVSSGIGGSGSANLTLTSQGGNLSDDTSCNSYFTHPSDQNNVSALADTLGPLGDYGGYVPTIPLLEGSPAIDAGITIPTLTTDARGVSRPLGLAYDSGAYESPFTRTVESTESLAGTGQDSTVILTLAMLFAAAGFVSILRARKSA